MGRPAFECPVALDLRLSQSSPIVIIIAAAAAAVESTAVRSASLPLSSLDSQLAAAAHRRCVT